ncbi:hypothetical protein ACP70R_024079 [Stipagrostis hirtigluma subsp. patula]
MTPPQFPFSRVVPRPGGERSVAGGKKPSSCLSPVAAPTKKIARSTSAPSLVPLSAARPRPPSTLSSMAPAPSTPAVASPAERAARPAPPPHGVTALSAARPRPLPPCASKIMAPSTPAGKVARPTPPSSAAGAVRPFAKTKTASAAPLEARKQQPRPAFMAPSNAETVHPARRLACGTAVYVRTTYVPANIKCRILLWLPARVVAASGASHYTVKYATDLNPMFAGKMVRMPTRNIRERAAAKTEPRKMVHERRTQ